MRTPWIFKESKYISKLQSGKLENVPFMKRKNANGYVSFAANSLRMERALGVIAACCGDICLAVTCRMDKVKELMS